MLSKKARKLHKQLETLIFGGNNLHSQIVIEKALELEAELENEFEKKDELNTAV